MERVTIIGSGPAAWTSAIYTARAQLEPVVYEGAMTAENQALGTLPMGQLALTTEVENFPGFPIGDLEAYLDNAIAKDRRMMMPPHAKAGVSGPELVELMRQQAVNFGTRILSEDIVDVDFNTKPYKLFTSGGTALETQSVIIATGARANYMGLESENRFKNRGVSACAVCDGGLPRFRNKPLAVIGGGDSAVEEADYLTKFSPMVYLVHRRNELRASKIMVKRAMEHERINIIWNRVLAEVLGNDADGVTGMTLKSTIGEPDIQVAVAGVFLGIGHTPNTAFLKGKIDLQPNGYIVRPVPFRTNTSVPGVFAAGDVADDYYRQAISAAGTGCMAGLDAERYLASLE
ncbi:MAG: FAD-dependent oxidoreductase [Planctomycetaceae bacterium]|jgi:thioredoxin reductase (NADPH)|nr:FAD-dependent oxidoreductase [Planctomycetaceae bacterium]